MSEKYKNIDQIALIGKYFDFEASPEEISILEDWVKQDKEHAAIFKSYRKSLELLHAQNIENTFSTGAEWQAFQNNINTHIIPLEPQKRNNKTVWFSIAASLLILVVFSVTYLWISHSTNTEATQANTLAVVLKDQSKIVLNHHSKIEYKRDFNEEERRLSLSGDAFFEVSPNKNKPFIVEVGALEVKVLGTAFYIDSENNNENIEVYVKHGKVSVTDKTGISVVLEKGEKASYKNNSLKEQKIKNINFDAWNTKTLIFEQTPLESVIETINKTYHTQLVIEDEALKTIPLTAAYQNKSLKSVLTILSESLDIAYVKKGDKTVVVNK